MKDILPARLRKPLYRVYAGAGVALGAIPVYCAATDASTPKWALGALAVFAFIGAPLFGETAAANTNTQEG